MSDSQTDMEKDAEMIAASTPVKRKPGRPKGSFGKPKSEEISDAELRILCLNLVWMKHPRLRLFQAGPIVEELVDYARTGDYGEAPTRD